MTLSIMPDVVYYKLGLDRIPIAKAFPKTVIPTYTFNVNRSIK